MPHPINMEKHEIREVIRKKQLKIEQLQFEVSMHYKALES